MDSSNHVVIWIFRYLVIWIFRDLVIWIFRDLVIWIFRDFLHKYISDIEFILFVSFLVIFAICMCVCVCVSRCWVIECDDLILNRDV